MISFFIKLFRNPEPSVHNRISPVMKAVEVSYEYGKNVVSNDDPDFDLLTDLVEYLLARFEANEWDEKKVLNTLPSWYFHAYLAWRFNHEVLNGGVLQYFYNSSGDDADDLLEAFRVMDDELLQTFMNNAIKSNEGFKKLEENKASDEDTDNFIETNHYILDELYYTQLEEHLYEVVHNYIKMNIENSGSQSFITP